LHGIQALRIKGSATVGHIIRGSMATGRIVNRMRPSIGEAERWGSTPLPKANEEKKLVQIGKGAA
jgi:hypothetical protein